MLNQPIKTGNLSGRTAYTGNNQNNSIRHQVDIYNCKLILCFRHQNVDLNTGILSKYRHPTQRTTPFTFSLSPPTSKKSNISFKAIGKGISSRKSVCSFSLFSISWERAAESPIWCIGAFGVLPWESAKRITPDPQNDPRIKSATLFLPRWWLILTTHLVHPTPLYVAL